MTAAYYAFTYLGFAAPYLLAVAAHAASYAILLLIMSGLAVLTAAVVRHGAREHESERTKQPQAYHGPANGCAGLQHRR